MAITILAAVAFATGSSVFADGEKTAPGHQKARGKGHAKHGDNPDDGTAASREAKFRSWDKDGNGSLSRGEYPGHPGNFRALDTDNDGALSFEEFQHRAGGGAPPSGGVMTEEFAAKDHDGSGTLTRAEWPDAFEFDRRDHNRDGVLSRDEYFSPRAPAARDEEFRRLDTDNDGVVVRGEWRGRPSVFDALDTNRNGVLSRDEYVRGSARGRLTK
jgi:Ca2+-binding EF-hand superfamily protein